jgi:hypothetical protein
VTNHRAVTATNPAVFDIDYQPVTGRLGLVKDLSPACTINIISQLITFNGIESRWAKIPIWINF